MVVKFGDFFIPFSQLQPRKLLESELISVLHGCTALTQIKQVHAHVFRKGLDQCSYVLAKLIRMLTKINVPMETYPLLLFQQVTQPNPFLWNAFIRGYTTQGTLQESVRLYSLMRRDGTKPVSFTFSALLKVCAELLNVNVGMQIHGQVILIGGFDADLYVGNTLINMYVNCGSLRCARKVFDEMPEGDMISWTSLIVAYTKCADMEAAGKLFDRMPTKDMVSWTAMVTGYAQNAKPKESLAFFQRMQELGIETDEVTLVGVSSACAQLGAAKFANLVRDVADKNGFGPTKNVVLGSALIDMYSKCGNVRDAFKVFKTMDERNVYSYSSMIMGFAMHGRADAAMELFHEMLKTEIKPNGVTFVGVLTACGHGGLVEEGRNFFASMEEDYGVSPSVDHYACMVDLLGRSGHLEESLELIKTMPMKPHEGVWGALLGACRIHVNPDIAQIAAEHLFQLEPNSGGNYILLSNIYASAGRWEDVSRVRKLMREKGLKKNPACSLFEGKKGEIHEFYAGCSTHPRTKEIKQFLGDLLDRLYLHGYQPNLDSVPYDVGDEEKKKILAGHSEKLALAFALLTTDSGSIIRIVKNLRICEDCHSFMSVASLVTGREIIIRDTMRFHHFENGGCSCHNFW